MAVQGPTATAQVTEALRELDADSQVDVIVITRGGGSVEDLLPFSEETLIRAVAGAATPVVSAIGHEQDAPLLDLVADLRASTPTDAARRIVPDVAAELDAVLNAKRRINEAVLGRLAAEQAGLDQVRSRPVMANPGSVVDARSGIAGRVVATQPARRRAAASSTPPPSCRTPGPGSERSRPRPPSTAATPSSRPMTERSSALRQPRSRP